MPPFENALFLFYRSFDRENLGKISEKSFVDLLKSKDDISDEEIKEMLDEYYRYKYDHCNLGSYILIFTAVILISRKFFISINKI